MSQNIQPDPPQGTGTQSATGGGMSGADTTGTNTQGTGQQLGGTVERKAEPVGESPAVKQPLSTPKGGPPEEESPRFARPAGRTVRSLLEELDDDEDEGTDPAVGSGPAFVVLHAGVKGPGAAAPFARGKVVRMSRLIGPEPPAGPNQERDRKTQLRQLKRLLTHKAIREATPEEAQHTEVQFIETTEGLGTALEQEQMQRVAAQSEATQLKEVIAGLGADPNASPAEIARQIRENALAQSGDVDEKF
jgi:hypothetical protein